MVQESGRSLKGIKKSKPSHNLEGQTEEDLKQQTRRDQVWKRKYKKRHRKDLTIEELEAIVAATRQPHRLHVDIA